MVSIMPWRRLVPKIASLIAWPKPPSCASSCSRLRAAGACACSTVFCARWASSSAADSRLIAVS
jgi:hypothetical protein